MAEQLLYEQLLEEGSSQQGEFHYLHVWQHPISREWTFLIDNSANGQDHDPDMNYKQYLKTNSAQAAWEALQEIDAMSFEQYQASFCG